MMEEKRNLKKGTLIGLQDSLISYFAPQTSEQNIIWSDKQAYIGLGTALIAAAELKVDTTPMEGFDPKLFDDILGLSARGLHASVIISLGYRDSAIDYLSAMPKVRLAVDDFSTKIY